MTSGLFSLGNEKGSTAQTVAPFVLTESYF